jgi:glycosyltransferase involved in cell wall biosynthesis
MKRSTILLSAYACEPLRGSEHGVGWNWARELASIAEVWVLTRTARRAAIERWEEQHGRVGVHWVYHDPSAITERMARRLGGVHLFYHVWQRTALPVARRLHVEVGFDIVHHLTMNAFREPGWLWRLPIPFVWGPIGGVQNAMPQLLELEDRRVRIAEQLRSFVNTALAHFSPRAAYVRRRADLILCANRDALDWARRGGRDDAILLLEAGVSDADTVPRSPDPKGRILWIGSDDARKNPRFAVAAFAALRRERRSLAMTMIGLSPEAKARLTRWAARHELALDGIEMLPTMPRTFLEPHWASATQLWFTSWRDTSGNVLLEALARRVPALAFAHQGAVDILADGAGELIQPADRPLARWIASARRLLDDPMQAEYMADRGSRLVRERFAWRTKAETVKAKLAAIGAAQPWMARIGAPETRKPRPDLA